MCSARYKTLLAAIPWAEEYLRDQKTIQEIQNQLYQLQVFHKTSEKMHWFRNATIFRNVTVFTASKC